MANLHNSKTYQKGKIDMTKAHKIKNLQSVVDKFSKLYNYHIFIDFNSMNNDTLYLLAEEDCKQLKQRLTQLVSDDYAVSSGVLQTEMQDDINNYDSVTLIRKDI